MLGSVVLSPVGASPLHMFPAGLSRQPCRGSIVMLSSTLFINNERSVNMPPRHLTKGEIVGDSERYARLATHLNSKKAGPLVCPICKATESFEAKGTLAGPRSASVGSADPQFNYATCNNCGYSIFFDAEALNLPG